MPILHILAHIVYGFCFFWLACVAGTAVATRRKIARDEPANLIWVSHFWFIVNILIFGIPTYLAGTFLRTHAYTESAGIIFVVAGSIGFLLGFTSEKHMRNVK